MQKHLLLITETTSLPLHNPNKESPFPLDKITVTISTNAAKLPTTKLAFYQLELPYIFTDYQQLQQILSNCLTTL